MIRLQQVSKSYGGTIKAVDMIDLVVEDGEIFGFLGPNGAGKTTTIKMVTGILPQDQGDIFINQYNMRTDALAAKRTFGYVPDDPNIYPRLKAIEYLQFISYIYQVPADLRLSRIRELADRFSLTDALTDRIQSYSHGMRQKLLIMGALLHNPDVWILDEPMTGLDPRSSFQLKEMMREHASAGNTVFFSTHVLDVAERVCDRVAVIDRGRILFCGTISAMQAHFHSSASLEAMFLQLIGDELPPEAQTEPGGPA